LANGCSDQGATAEPEPAETRVVSVFHKVHVSSVETAEYFQHAVAAVDFGTDSLARATLSLSLESPCFPFDNWTAESIPEGHNFPKLCDGFDRTLLVSLDDPSGPEEGPPGIELVHAITPFGGPLVVRADITDIANGLPGLHELHVDIQTWGDGAGLVSGAEGEWIVSSRLVLEPGPAPREVLAVVPLSFGNRTDAAAAPLPFTTPEGTTSARLEYRTTGHGGALVPDDTSCIGPAEEFCQRSHTLLLDGALLGELSPWRTDCASLCTLSSYQGTTVSVPEYCAENPTGLPASVRAPRANWCPGSVTPPFVFETPELAVPGDHELSVELDVLAEGGLWAESLLYFAYE
jgi:hypothetical protein